MDDAKPPTAPAPEPESPRTSGTSRRFWRAFWLSFLVVSLAYAWHSFYVPANRIDWADDYTTAQQQAVASGKPIILFFTGEWCVPCRIMKREVWADEEVLATVHAAFIPVTIDVDDPDAAATLNRYAVGATPSTIITDAQGEVLQRRAGGLSKADFLEMLGRPNPPVAEDL